MATDCPYCDNQGWYAIWDGTQGYHVHTYCFCAHGQEEMANDGATGPIATEEDLARLAEEDKEETVRWSEVSITNTETGETIVVSAEQAAQLQTESLPYADLVGQMLSEADSTATGRLVVGSAEFGFLLATAGYLWFGRE